MKNFIIVFALIVFLFSFKKKEITWTAIGDSITYLNDHADETGNRVTKGYMTRVTDKLNYIHYTNQGHNGWTVVGIATKIDSLGIIKSDVYSIFLGTNDWWQGIPLGTIKDYINATGTRTTCGSFRLIINKIRSLNSAAKIILITPMQRADFVYISDMSNNAFGSYKSKNNQKLEDFANAVKTIAKYEHFNVVDLYHAKGMDVKDMVHFKKLKDPATGKYHNYAYPQSIAIPFNPQTDEYPYPKAAVNITYDGLHPSDKGNQMIADKLINVFGKM